GEDGKRRRDDKALSMNLSYPDGDLARELVAKSIAGMWEAVGVTVSVEKVPASAFYGDVLTKARFLGVALYGWKLQPFVVPLSAFHSKEIPLAQNEYTGQNISGWHSREVD